MPPRRGRRDARRRAQARRVQRREEELKNRIREAYTTPGHPIAFSAPAPVAKYFQIPIKKASKYLQEIQGYVLHREYKRPQRYIPYYVKERRRQVQGDLIDIGTYARENDGIKFLLVLIDIFTKKLWVFPMKNKSGRTTRDILERWLRNIDEKPKKLVTDRGLEFTNRPVQTLLTQNRVAWRAAFGTLKACIAERVNKTLQILIFKYMTETRRNRYIDKLQDFVSTYNNRGHRTLKGMTPNEADRPENEARVRTIHEERYEEAERHRQQKPKFKVGDIVRLKTLPKKIGGDSRAYSQQFTGEYFTISAINRTFPVFLYHLRSMNTHEEIAGGLYANELVRQRGNVYQIENVLDERVGRNGRPEYLVKFLYFGNEHNDWIKERDLIGQGG